MKGLFGSIIALTTIQLVISKEERRRPKTKDTCSKFKCERKHADVKVGHFSGFVIEGRFLNDSKQKAVSKQNEKECVKGCVKQKLCRTISVIQKDVKNFTCYLSNSNIYEGKVIVKKNSKIISLGTPECLKAPCKNGGTCKPNYDKGGYACVCLANWKGTHCTEINQDILPNVTFTFDKDVKPIFKDAKRGKNYGITVTKLPRVVSVPDAKTPVLMSKSGEEKPVATYTASNMPFLTNPLVPPRNLTLGFWFKAGLEQKRKESVVLFSVANYYGIRVRPDELELELGTGQGYKKLICENVVLHKTWNHVILRISKKHVKLVLNGNGCGALKVDGISNMGGYGTKIELLSRPAYCTRFIDSLKIYNDFVKVTDYIEWYKNEKKNYLIPESSKVNPRIMINRHDLLI